MKNRKKIIFYLISFLFIYIFSFYLSIKYYLKKDESLVLKNFINENSTFITKKKDKRFVAKIIGLIASIDFNNPISLINNNYLDVQKVSADDDKDIMSLPDNNYIKDPNPEKEISKPIIYLYNTHQSEEYKVGLNSEYDVKPTVMTVSYMLREMLNKNGLNTIVEENDVLEFLRTNNWNYAASYKVTRLLLDDIITKEPTLKYFIDLHRDSVSKNISTTTIDGITYAKVLFILGLENSNYEANLKITEKINNMINEKYPGLSRGIYKKKGPGVNGVYNQDFNPNTILIEVGGQENTIDEVYNTSLALSIILTEYIKGDLSE